MPLRSRTAIARCLAAAVGSLGATAPARDAVVATRDGTRVAGDVDLSGDLVRVRQADREVLLSRAAVARVSDWSPPPAGEPPEYLFNKALVSDTPKRGIIRPEVRTYRAGDMTAEGLLPVALRDPDLGFVTFRAAVTGLGPEFASLEGVDYGWAARHPTAQLGPPVEDLVASATPARDAAAQLKAARFFRLAGLPDVAAGYLDRLAALDPAHPALASERDALDGSAGDRAWVRARRWIARGKPREALAELSAVPRPPPGFEDEFARTRAELEARLAAHERVRAWSARRPRGLKRITAAEAERLDRILRLGRADERDVPNERLPLLLAPWADPLAAAPLDDATLDEAAALAAATAAFFAADPMPDPRSLAGKFSISSLPLALRAAIFARAATFPADASREWHRVGYRHPELGADFHYWVQPPADYRPDVACPVLVVLAGQGVPAEFAATLWGETALAWGFLLIGAEYVYGREAGYRFSTEEQEAVLGAVRHAAATYAIDRDRVFLTGFSQGGHAAWDIGAGRAGEFAGVLPVCGAPAGSVALGNYRDTALHAIEGRLDRGGPVANRRALDTLAALGATARYAELRDRGHEAFPGEYPALALWMSQTARRRAGLLDLDATRPSELRRRWIEVRGTRRRLPDRAPAGGGPRATVSARIHDNKVELATENVAALRVWLDPRLVDFGREVRVFADGRLQLTRRPAENWAPALEEAFRRRDRTELFLDAVDVALGP